MSRVKISRFVYDPEAMELRGRASNLVDWVWPQPVAQELADHMVKEITRSGMVITASRWRQCSLFADEVARDFR